MIYQKRQVIEKKLISQQNFIAEGDVNVGARPWQEVPATRWGTEEVRQDFDFSQFNAHKLLRILLVLCFI
jgi:hypothetical protein